MNIKRAREIINQNRYIIYHLPKKYPYLGQILANDKVKSTLLQIYKFISDKDIIIYKHKYEFFLSTKQIMKIRGKTGEGTANRYINYLCCIGLINKQYQHLDYNGEEEKTELTNINFDFMVENADRPINRPINTFYFRLYSDKELNRLEQRAKLLIQNNITPSNVGFNRLSANNCKEIANEVYYAIDRKVIAKKKKELKALYAELDKLIKYKGYAKKSDIKNIDKTELDKLFKIFKEQIREKYIYKAPNKAEKAEFKLKDSTWIIRGKDEGRYKAKNNKASTKSI